MRNSRPILFWAFFSVCLVQPPLLAQREALDHAFDAVLLAAQGDLEQHGLYRYPTSAEAGSIEEAWGGRLPQGRFDHVLVLNGMGLDFGLHLGMIDAAMDAGRPPDVIIGSCGGNFSAWAYYRFSDWRDRLNYLSSEELYLELGAFFADPEKHRSLWGNLRLVLGSLVRKQGRLANRPQDYFGQSIAEIPPNILDGSQPISRAVDGTRFILLAAKTDLTPENLSSARIRGQKHYWEALFTDAETAEMLGDYRSPLGLDFPRSLVRPEVVIRTDLTFGQAIRMGIADPFVFEPGQLEDGYYLTGGINLNPLELASGIGKVVTIAFREGFDFAFNTVTYGGVFQYDTRQRQRIVSGLQADYWVDFSDRSRYDDWQIGFRLTEGLPETHRQFREHILRQYILGYLRTAEAYCLAPNAKWHLRDVTRKEASKDLRRALETEKHARSKVACRELADLQVLLEELLGIEMPRFEEAR